MNKKEILEACEEVFFSFDSLTNLHDSTQFDQGRLTNLIGEFVPFPPEEEERAREDWFKTINLAFALGFVIGQEIDLKSSAVLKLRELLREKSLLAYFPRKREAA